MKNIDHNPFDTADFSFCEMNIFSSFQRNFNSNRESEESYSTILFVFLMFSAFVYKYIWKLAEGSFRFHKQVLFLNTSHYLDTYIATLSTAETKSKHLFIVSISHPIVDNIFHVINTDLSEGCGQHKQRFLGKKQLLIPFF